MTANSPHMDASLNHPVKIAIHKEKSLARPTGRVRERVNLEAMKRYLQLKQDIYEHI